MLLKRIFLLSLLFTSGFCFAQNKADSALIDTSFYDIDEIFSELDALLDSINSPRSFTVISASAGKNFFDYSASSSSVTTRSQYTFSPSIGYYHKSGLGLSAGATILHDGTTLNPFQFSATGSYDYLRTKSIITGVSFTHFETKPDLPFYTSPLQNEVYGYFSLRKLWFRPSVAASYGWGTRESYEERKNLLKKIKLTKKGFTRINNTTTENIIDFNLMASVRHDFYFLHLFSSKDYLRLTPQITFTSGTQQFGFNMVTTNYASNKRNGRNALFTTQSTSYDDQLYFQPLSLTTQFKSEYVFGKFFIQPQFLVDYYFPATEQNISTSFFVNAGFVF